MSRTIVKGLMLAGLAGLSVFAGGARPADPQSGFVLIVNQANPVVSLRAAEVSRLFLRKQTKWPNGQRAEPVDQVESSVTRRHFSDVVHGMDVPSVYSYWQEIVFSGRGEPPPERASDAEVVAFVRANVNAFGYVSPAAPVTGVKVLTLAR